MVSPVYNLHFTHTHVHTPTCTHNYTHTHTLHVYPHTHTHTCTNTRHTHTCTRTYTRAQTQHTHTTTHTCTNTTHTRAHTHTHTQLHTHTLCMCTHTHTCTNITHTHTHTHTSSSQDGERLKHWSPVPGYIPATQGSIPFSLLQSPVSGAVRNSTRGLGFTLEVECLVQHQKIVQYVSHRVPRVRQEQPGGSQALRQRSCLLVSAFDFRMMV